MTETIKTLHELTDNALAHVQGGASFVKFKGLDGESMQASCTGPSSLGSDPSMRGANPMDLKRG